MNTNTRRAATLTAALIIAGTLAACGDDGSGGTDPAQAVVTDEVGDGGATVPTEATWGQSVDAPDGSGTFTISEPVAEEVNVSEYLGEVELADGFRIDVTYTNTTGAPVDAVEGFDFMVWSGEGEGYRASPGDGSDDPAEFHLTVPDGRTATWTQYWVVDDPADVVYMVAPGILGDIEQTWSLTFTDGAPEGEDW